jgi:hypothetical protein
VGLTTALYGDADAVSWKCGRQIKVTSLVTGNTVVAIVADACVGFCGDKNEDLVLSIGAYSALQENALDLGASHFLSMRILLNSHTGILDVVWEWVDEQAGTPASNPYVPPSPPAAPISQAATASSSTPMLYPAASESATKTQTATGAPPPCFTSPAQDLAAREIETTRTSTTTEALTAPTTDAQPTWTPEANPAPPTSLPTLEPQPASIAPAPSSWEDYAMPNAGDPGVYSSGQATYYEQKGIQGHCGEWNK